jgi:signal transduction histidine kinase
VVVVDRRYDIQTINAAARRLLSIRGAAIGEDLLHALQEEVPYAEIRFAIDSAFKDGISTTGEFSVEEATSGEIRYIQLICNPQRERLGVADTVTIVVNDITEIGRSRRELEESLRETRAEMEAFTREMETPQARVAEGESFTLDFTAEAQDGVRRHFEAQARPIGSGKGRGGVIVVREVEEV